jgi:acetylglutamate kinase
VTPETEVPPLRELLVIKLGGTTLAEQDSVLREAAAVAATRDVVLVHGGGKRLSAWLERLGIESHFADGLRVTDDDAIEVALAVFRGVINTELVAALQGMGADAVGISGVDGGLLIAERVPELGRVATVTGARPAVLYALWAAGKVPVVAPLALDEAGVICNVNADDVAAGLAGGLHARLVLLTDTDGVRDAKGNRVPVLDAARAESLISTGVISGGMVPKVRSSLRALSWSGAEAVIVDGAAHAAISRALDDPSFGTRLRGEAGLAPGGRETTAAAG